MTESLKADLLAAVICIIAAAALYFAIAGGGIDRILFDSPEQVSLYKEAVKQ
jgi:hypothetical protein